WWKFDGNLNDLSGNGRNGAHVNTTDFENLTTTGKFGSALSLDGVNEHINVTGYKGITGSAARTMSAWIKTSKSDAAIMNWGQNASRKKWTFRTQTNNGLPGATRVEINGGARVGDVGVDDDSWHHVAAVLSGANLNSLTLYLDGQPLGNSFTSGGGNTINTTAS
ncbi:MAG: LamG-like jellyroll fold domain-containing protein, partial [Opitutae bacterium]